MVLLGVSVAIVTQSEAILLDGVYSLMNLVMALLASRVSGLVERQGSERFQFGYAKFEPLLNAIRGLLIFAILAFAFVSAVSALFSGGRPVSAGIALVYCLGAGSVSSCLLRRSSSPTARPCAAGGWSGTASRRSPVRIHFPGPAST